jgi:tetratricopeptide (TPR) repeat protein
MEVAPAIAKRIEYRALNLVHEPLPVEPGSFDVIFLRNVLIYFRPESQRRVAAAIARALAPGGVLFVGPAETLWQITGELEPVDLEDCFCYRHAAPTRARPEVRGPGLGVRIRGAEARGQGPGAREETTGTERGAGRMQAAPRWVGRRHTVTPRPASPAGAQPDPRPRSPVPGLTGTRERLAAAVASLVEGRMDRAVELLDQALLSDPADPAAHGLEGFVHDVSGRTQMSVASYRAALFLDASLFQVRLLLADALRRLGHSQRAMLEYREVMATLAAGAAHVLESLAHLPLPDAEQARQRCREALVDR